MKTERQKRILELVAELEIETQDELTERLRLEGYMVTQATVSRDLKELKLTKTPTSHGGYKYSVNAGFPDRGSARINVAMADSIVQVDYSLNNVVINTYPGMAQAVAFAIDSLQMQSVLGCVAGDDTIIIVTRDTESSAELSGKIRELMKSV